MSRNDIVKDIRSTLHAFPPFPTSSCIFKVPYTIRRANPEEYTPVRLSVGPFHHGKENLHEMEVHKQRYLSDFLKRRADLNLEKYIETLEGLEVRVRNCYAENINYTSNDFIKMMLLDGCFVVELFIKFLRLEFKNKDDSILKSYVILNELRRDLLVLENQLPFFVFEDLFNLNVESQLLDGHSFLALTVNFMVNYGGHHGELNSLRNSNCQGKHLLDIYHQCYTPTTTTSFPQPVGSFLNLPSTTRLHNAGIKFRRATGSAAKCFLDVKFHDGIFEIPTLILGDDTETLFRNLIAFEQCDTSGNTQYLSDYIFLMDCLIDTPEDVALLREVGTIDNFLGDDEEGSQMINKLGVGVVSNLSVYYGPLCKDVNDYCSTQWHVWRAKLRRDYFDSPWAIISVIAAVTLLILAFIQTICSVIQL